MASLDTQLDRAIVERGGLHEFVKIAWSQVESVPFKDNWHIREECKALQAVSEGKIRKLIINVPPGTGKSLIVSVFWQAWQWIIDPGHRFLAASFDHQLVNRDAMRVIKLVQSDWFQERWPEVYTANEAQERTVNVPKSCFWTTRGGLRFSTSIKGKGTGYHAHTHVIDDPLKPRDAEGKRVNIDSAALQEVITWWKSTLVSRQVDAANTRKVVIMQRLHEDDLVGYLEDSEDGWLKLCLPMEYDPDLHTKIELADGTILEDPRTREGELLDPGRYPAPAVAELKKTMGSQVAAAQLQQRPAPASGNMFKKDWFRQYDHVPQDFDYLIQSWDMSFKGTDGSDFVVGDLWGIRGADAYLLPGWIEKRLGFSATCDEMTRFCNLSHWHRMAFLKLVEDKANGPAVVDSLKKKIPGLVLVNPDGGKEARAASVTPFYESGNVWHPSPLLDSRIVRREAILMGFPNVKNDDVVDTTSQALLRIFVRSVNLVAAMKQVAAQG